MDQIRLGLIGDRISESRVPDLNLRAASQLNIELSDDLIMPSHQGLDFEECLTHARHLGLSGYGGLSLPEDNSPETCRWIFDAVCTPVDTPFSALAKSRGAKFILGFELFFFQGVDAFHLFTGRQVKDEQALHQALMSSNTMETNK